ncbi:MAG TPA: biotin/lipoate A/B protein ligase family protein [Candidatus Limnocylindrales bacterium]|nr:biotin/lipoate A/B protein ligase family protein [Candidatus Limnocylindrales bacterium]
MDAWRLLPLKTNNAFMNMAIDEAILTTRTSGLVPNTLRFYRWKPSAVSIGKNQNPEAEVYLDACERLGVDVVRRMSGGGTVYHGYDGEVTYCVIAKTADLGTADITTVYAKIYEAIKCALGLLGITADFRSGDAKNCPNMTVKGKKISGSSQAITRGVVLQHGTVLRSVDLTKMFMLLKLKNASCSEAADIAERKITSIEKELYHAVAHETVTDALARGFTSALKIELEPSELTPYEVELAKHLYKEKYATKEWIFVGKTH